MPLNRETIITLGSKLAPAAITFGRLRTLLQDPNTELESIVDLVRLAPGADVSRHPPEQQCALRTARAE